MNKSENQSKKGSAPETRTDTRSFTECARQSNMSTSPKADVPAEVRPWLRIDKNSSFENDSNSTYCEECGCRITAGRCKHGVTPPNVTFVPETYIPNGLPIKPAVSVANECEARAPQPAKAAHRVSSYCQKQVDTSPEEALLWAQCKTFALETESELDRVKVELGTYKREFERVKQQLELEQLQVKTNWDAYKEAERLLNETAAELERVKAELDRYSIELAHTVNGRDSYAKLLKQACDWQIERRSPIAPDPEWLIASLDAIAKAEGRAS